MKGRLAEQQSTLFASISWCGRQNATSSAVPAAALCRRPRGSTYRLQHLPQPDVMMCNSHLASEWSTCGVRGAVTLVSHGSGLARSRRRSAAAALGPHGVGDYRAIGSHQ